MPILKQLIIDFVYCNMTTEEFKKLKPEFKDLEGNALWNAMEDYQLTIQSGDEILKQIKPIWKTHTLRWLFYRKPSSNKFPSGDKFRSNKRCSSCKNGVNLRMCFILNGKSISYCPHCGEEYIEEPNTNLSHKAYMLLSKLINLFWLLLDKLHIVRSSYDGRYDMFGDEGRYVKYYRFDKDYNPLLPVMCKRKWYEYIIIEKRHHS